MLTFCIVRASVAWMSVKAGNADKLYAILNGK